jgi:hypothetical protein
MITIDANAMVVGIMNPVYSKMCASMALQRYIHKEKKRKNEKVRINVNPSDDLPSISIIKGFVAAYQFEARVNRGSQLTATGS